MKRGVISGRYKGRHRMNAPVRRDDPANFDDGVAYGFSDGAFHAERDVSFVPDMATLDVVVEPTLVDHAS